MQAVGPEALGIFTDFARGKGEGAVGHFDFLELDTETEDGWGAAVVGRAVRRGTGADIKKLDGPDRGFAREALVFQLDPIFEAGV